MHTIFSVSVPLVYEKNIEKPVIIGKKLPLNCSLENLEYNLK